MGGSHQHPYPGFRWNRLKTGFLPCRNGIEKKFNYTVLPDIVNFCIEGSDQAVAQYGKCCATDILPVWSWSVVKHGIRAGGKQQSL